MNSDHDGSLEPESSVDPNSVEGVFIAALTRSAGGARLEFVKTACGDDTDRLTRVEVLLRAYEDSGSFLQQPAANINPLDSFSQYFTPSDKSDVIGELGNYEILETIGRGGMGVVFRALDPKLNRIVAIKVLAPELSNNPNSRRRFLREAQAVASVAHPHIVMIHAVNDDRLPYFVMECIVGQSLQQKLDKSGALSLQEVLRIGQQIAEGLSAAHRQGIIHRDIKPANILLENGVERVRITDFGLARARDDESITLAGEVSGTPMYMSPEQTRGELVDHRSDLFSLGALLYAMCTGHSPFRGANMAAVVKNVCDVIPRPVSEFNSEFPAWLDSLIGSLLDKNPNVRPDNAESIAETLRQGLSGEQPAVPAYAAPISAAREVQSLARSHAQAKTSTASRSLTSKHSEMTIAEAVNLQAGQLKRLTIISLIVSLALILFGQTNNVGFAIHPRRVWLLLLPIGLAQFLGWFSFHMSRFGLGKEAWWKGVLGSLTALLMLPTFILSVPVGLATLTLLTRKGVKAAFQKAADGDLAALHETVPRPRASFLMKCLGTAMTFSACLLLFQSPNVLASPPIPEALLVTILISLGALLLNPIIEQFSSDEQHAGLAFLKRPVLAAALFALTTAVLVAPFIPQLWASRKANRSQVYFPTRQGVAIDEPAQFALDDSQVAILDHSERGGLISTIAPGLVVELHRDGLTWQFSANGMISPRKMQQTGGGMTVFFGRRNGYDAGDFGSRFNGMSGWGEMAGGEDMFGIVGGGSMNGMSSMGGGMGADEDMAGMMGGGVGAGMMGGGMASVTPFERSDIFVLPVGIYEVLVFDARVGWGRCNLWAIAENEEDPLDIDSGAFSILSESHEPGSGNELPAPFAAAYQTSAIEIKSAQIATLNIERDFGELAAIEPAWDQSGLFRFTWGNRVWTLDKLQAQCVQQLLKSHRKSESVRETDLLKSLITDAESVIAIFNDGKHPAFGKLIIADETDESERRYRLSDFSKTTRSTN